MQGTPTGNRKKKKGVVYVRPVLSYDQIVEIIDKRITAIEKASKKEKKRKN